MAQNEPTRRLAAILAADLVAFSRLVAADEAGTLARWRVVQQRLIDPAVAGHRGRIFKTTGDGFLAIFDSAVDAVECAARIQAAITDDQRAVPEPERLRLRIGVNLGDVYVDGTDVLGDGVNVAARLQTAADPDGILVSRAVAEQARGRLPIRLVDLGKKAFHNLPRPLRVYRAEWTRGAAPAAPHRGRVYVRRRAVGLAALAAALFGVALAWWLGALPFLGRAIDITAQDDRGQPTIAVLPFAEFGDDPANSYFGDGLTEDVITALGRFPSLAVISRNSSFRYKGREIDPKTVGRELGAQYVLEGSVRREGERLRVSARLIDARTGAQLWAERYDEDARSVFELQDEITRRVAALLVRHITRAEIERAERQRPAQPSAYETYLQALAAQRAHLSAADPAAALRQGRTLLERAIALDPRFAPSYVILANNYMASYLEPHVEGEYRNPANLDRARGAAQQALRLDPSSSEALAALAWVSRYRGTVAGLEEAESLFRRAAAINPSRTDGRYADVLARLGRPAEALESVRDAIRLDPFYPPQYDGFIGHAQFMLGRTAEALESLERCVSQAPGSRLCRVWLAAALAETGRAVDAASHVDWVLRTYPEFRVTDELLLYRRSEDRERMRKALEAAGFRV